MEKLKESTAAKVIAVLLAALTFVSSAAFSLLSVYMLASGYYTDSYDEVMRGAVESYVDDNALRILRRAREYIETDPDYVLGDELGEVYILSDDSNFQYVLLIDGKVISDSFKENGISQDGFDPDYYERSQFCMIEDREYDDFDYDETEETDSTSHEETEPPETESMEPDDTGKFPETEAVEASFAGYSSGRVIAASVSDLPPEITTADTGSDDPLAFEEFTLTVRLYLRDDLGFVVEYQIAEKLYGIRYTALAVAAISIILTIASWVFAVSAAGHRRGVAGFYLSMFDRTPLDLMLILAALLTAAAGLFLGELTESLSGKKGTIIFAVAASLVAFIISAAVTVLSMTVASRVKSGALRRYNMIYYFFRFVRRAVMTIPIVWRTLLGSVISAIVSLWLIVAADYSNTFGFIVVLIMLWIILIGFSCYRAYCMRRLRLAGKRLASGDLSHRIDTSMLYGDYRQHALDLNNIGAGMTAAVEERMKSERFKTELITNVSHDIKTPLTSIINYIDLLKTPDLDPETARTYLEILDRQSGKLRRLTEDLVEASKASSGALPVSLSLCDLSVLVSQLAGEHEERLASQELTLIVKKPDFPVNVMADGRHTARIFDNLMSNVLKYSLPGTRVYLDLTVSGDFAAVSLRNISREPIDVSPDELTERFVRGDASRHTEGSGLGLSIAKSLAELQGGTLSIETDGDLFRATLWFKIVK